MAAKTTLRVSLINNAAKDDIFTEANYSWLNEDMGLEGNLNVLGNDPGSARLLGVSDVLPDTQALLTNGQDTILVTLPDGTFDIRIAVNTDGTVYYDATDLIDHLDYLADGATFTTTFYYTAQMANGAYSTAKVDVIITGENDAPVAVADSNAGDAVTEAGVNPGNTAFVGDASATGNVLTNDTDVDAGDSKTVTTTGSFTGTYGTLNLAANGDWTYTLDNADADTHALAQGQSVADAFNYTMRDTAGATSSSTLSITIAGINDAPVAVADTNAGNEDTVITGSVATNDSDIDNGAVLTYSLDAPVAGLILNTDGSYSFDATNAAYQTLAAGVSADIVAHYTVTDEHGASSSSTLTIALTGANDAPVAVADSNAGDAVTEAGVNPGNTAFAGDASATGNVLTNDTDVDAGDSKTVTTTGSFTGTYGTLNLAADGDWTYMLDNADADTQALAKGQPVADVFNYTIRDAVGATSSSTLSITIAGTNDSPRITSDAQTRAVTEIVDGAFDENAIRHAAAGVMTFSDVDTIDTHGAAFTAQGPGYRGTFEIAPVDQAGDSVRWTLTVADGELDDLAADETLTQEYEVTVSDGNGATATQTVTVTLAGTNDAPVVSAEAGDSAGTATPIEESDTGLTASGTLTVNDADLRDAVTLSVHRVNATGPTGGLSESELLSFLTVAPANLAANSGDLNNLGWVFNSGAQAFDYLAAGQTLTLSYTVRATDNSGAGNSIGDGVVTVRIAGTDDNTPPIIEVDKQIVLPVAAGVVDLQIAAPIDVDGDHLTITVTALPNAGTVRIGSENGGEAVVLGQVLTPAELTSLVYDAPSQGDSAITRFAYSVSDGVEVREAEITIDLRESGQQTVLLFAARDGGGLGGTQAGEPWLLNASGAMTQIADLIPGPFGSNPYGFTEFNGEVYFGANSSGSVRSLFKIEADSTVVRIADYNANGPSGFTEYQGELYYVAGLPGTSAPTLQKVTADGNVLQLGSQFTQITTRLTEFNGELYFGASTPATGTELWKVTATGSVMAVSDIQFGSASSSPNSLAVLSGELYFTAISAASGNELWKVTGEGAVVQVADINLGTNSSSPARLTAYNDSIYFDAVSSTGRELWRLNPQGSAEQVADIAAGTLSSNAQVRGVFFGELYFTASPSPSPVLGVDGSQLYKVTSSGAIAQVSSGAFNISGSMVELNGAVYFAARADRNEPEYELWSMSDNGALSKVSDLFPGSSGSAPSELTVFDNSLYFSAIHPDHGQELWRLTATGTIELVGDINTATQFFVSSGTGYPAGSSSSILQNGSLYFAAKDDIAGNEVWMISGTGELARVADINTGFYFTQNFSNLALNSDASPAGFSRIGEDVYFLATSATGKRELWKIDESGQVSMVADGFTFMGAPVGVNGDCYFAGSKVQFAPAQLWGVQADGTAALVSSMGSVANLCSFGDSLYFTASTSLAGSELWRLPPAGLPQLVSDINPGSGSSNIVGLTEFNGSLYFQANNGTLGAELWRVLPSGQVEQVANINAGASSSTPNSFFEFEGALYFRASNGSTGVELWRVNLDGTVSQVADINTGIAGSDPNNFREFNGELYFTATGDGRGAELWKLNDSGGVVRLTDINPNSGSASPWNLTEFNGDLYFQAARGNSANGIYKIDAFGVVTLIDEPASQALGQTPGIIGVLGDKLYFMSAQPDLGQRVFAVGLDGQISVVDDMPIGSSSPSQLAVATIGTPLGIVAASGPGNDIFVAGEGADIFSFAPDGSDDVVLNFDPSADLIDVSAFDVSTFDDLLAHADDQGGIGPNTILYLEDGTTITIADTRVVDLNEGAFRFM